MAATFAATPGRPASAARPRARETVRRCAIRRPLRRPRTAHRVAPLRSAPPRSSRCAGVESAALSAAGPQAHQQRRPPYVRASRYAGAHAPSYARSTRGPLAAPARHSPPPLARHRSPVQSSRPLLASTAHATARRCCTRHCSPALRTRLHTALACGTSRVRAPTLRLPCASTHVRALVRGVAGPLIGDALHTPSDNTRRP